MIQAPTLETEERPRYEVRLDVFSGPLDLLLHLIQRGELDITVVSLASVADQYVAYLEAQPEMDPDQLAGFLVIAARLLAIKAAVLLAPPAAQVSTGEQDGEDLARALREYQLFQRASAVLREWEGMARRAYPRLVPTAPIILPAADGLTVGDLVAALRTRPKPAPLPTAPVAPSERVYTIEDKVAVIARALLASTAITFRELLPPLAPPVEVIVTFLALLHMLRQREASAMQSAAFGEIVIQSFCGHRHIPITANNPVQDHVGDRR